MLPSYIVKGIKKDDEKIARLSQDAMFFMPKYDPQKHYKHLSNENYYHALIVLRHYLKVVSDYYFGVKQKAKNIDLFMITSSISSPAGSGSDSEPIRIKFGKCNTCLVDSSQFGFEPILLNGFNKVYCYLPSMRGENPDSRHLNQFYHCEAEIAGGLNKLFPIIEGYIKYLCETMMTMSNILEKISSDSKKTKVALNKIIKIKKFPEITFDKAVELLVKNGKKDCIKFTKYGRDINFRGEIEIMKILNLDVPLWIKNFDRDRVPFYQKPDPKNKNKAINADLLFPPLMRGAFGGEIVGSGQRQDNPNEMYDSLRRQNNISSDVYEWYIDLRKSKKYKITSGFGIGIERFITWALAKKDIKDTILYPRIKNVKSTP